MASKPSPFALHVLEADLADLRERLARTRFPDHAPGDAWAYGADVGYLRQLTEYWRNDFDWRAEEAALNAFPQFRVPLDGIDLHYLHVPGVGPDPMPLLLLHGWPGSVFEFLEIIPRLTDPQRFGGDARDAFTVVAPSLPGYGLSFQPGQKRFGVPEMADCVAALMRDVLGYARFGAQGGDWGAAVTSRLGYAHADRMIGIHINLMMAAGRDPSAFPNPTEEEQRYLSELAHWMREESGYQWIQGTRPQTLAFGLTDSPAGLAAWIVEKFRTWSDCDGNVERAISPRSHARRHIALLVYRGDRLVVLALLCPPSRLGDSARRRYDFGTHRLCAIPARNPQAAAWGRGARVHQHSPLEHHVERWTFRSAGAAGTARR
jgi:pimeloyl-ACP methyl ester carboxylesterase